MLRTPDGLRRRDGTSILPIGEELAQIFFGALFLIGTILFNKDLFFLPYRFEEFGTLIKGVHWDINLFLVLPLLCSADIFMLPIMV